MRLAPKFFATLALVSATAFAGEAPTVTTQQPSGSVNVTPRSQVSQYVQRVAKNPTLYQTAIASEGAVVDPGNGLVTVPTSIDGELVLITIDRDGNIIDVRRQKKKKLFD